MKSIFCSDMHNVIGVKSTDRTHRNLAYRIREDLTRFEQLTIGTVELPSILITGYNTYMSFGGTEEECEQVLNTFKSTININLFPISNLNASINNFTLDISNSFISTYNYINNAINNYDK